MYPREILAHVPQEPHTRKFITPLFVIEKHCKQHNILKKKRERMVNKLWYIHGMGNNNENGLQLCISVYIKTRNIELNEEQISVEYLQYAIDTKIIQKNIKI